MEYMVRRNTAIDLANGTSRVYGNCAFSGQEYVVVVETAALQRFVQGEPAQKCFPEMDPDQREFLISGISPEGWNITLGKND